MLSLEIMNIIKDLDFVNTKVRYSNFLINTNNKKRGEKKEKLQVLEHIIK